MNWKLSFFLFLILLSSCSNGDLAAEKNKILEVSFSGKDMVWLITRENDLLELDSNGYVHKWELFSGKARLVFFLNNERGWVFDKDGKVWSYTNESWELVGSITDFGDIVHASGIVFYDDDNGWITTSSGLLNTTDGGRTWREKSPDSAERGNLYNVTDFKPKDADSGWLMFTQGAISFTDDGGLSWKFEYLEGKGDMLSISCRKQQTCLFGSGGRGLFLVDWDNTVKTKSVGPDHLSDYAIKSISHPTDQIVWITGFKFLDSPDENLTGMLMRSEDGGESWTSREFPKAADSGEQIHFEDSATGWLISKDTVFRTTNAGTDWVKVFAMD